MRAQLIDLSKWNQSFEPALIDNQPEIALHGVILRTSYGLMPDRLFPVFVRSSQDIPVRGGYHYFSSGAPWDVQAKFFLDQVQG